ncbi:MAG: spore coat protein [Oscillospiraceae bacterium]|nr:spore coat protein [Oscillospiraceae bacterium]
MDDKSIMENILLTTKGVIDLYMHGAVESPTGNVRQTFSTALNDALTMQSGIYSQMSSHGWYSTEQASQQQIQHVKQKYSCPTC